MLLAQGFSPSVADAYLELYASWDSGALESAEPRTPETMTPTTFSQFAREVIRPFLPTAPAS
jgi:hypothetical protein